MIGKETRNQVKSMVNDYSEGISLNHLHNKFHRKVTRLQLRTLLGAMYMRSEISRERMITYNKRETKYFPFNGKSPVKRKMNRAKDGDSKMLSMKDFMPGKKYAAYIDF
jgi:hypothetical protein